MGEHQQATTKPPVVKIDKSKPFATVHGERPPDDPHANVHFFQDSIPFDVRGEAIPSLINDDKGRKAFERKMKRLSMEAEEAEVDVAAEDAENADDDDDVTADDVNLESWLRGEVKYPWFKVSAAIRDRYSLVVINQSQAVRFLVMEQKLETKATVSEKFKDFLN